MIVKWATRRRWTSTVTVGVVAAVCVLMGGCAHNRPPSPPPLPSAPLVFLDNDDRPVPMPAYDEEGDFVYWDATYAMGFLQMEHLLDAGYMGERVGHRLGVADLPEAENVNALDEVPDSTWFTNRQGKAPLSVEELQKGANEGGGPDLSAPLKVIGGKGLGKSPGLIVEDSRGDRYLIKFDPIGFEEMNTATEILASKIVHAAGYNVPEYYIVNIDPENLVLGDGARIRGKYKKKRAMTQEDIFEIFKSATPNKDGTYRTSASKFIEGKPVGPPPAYGTRKDDPNDTVKHENRRELRGLRIISSWLNHNDLKRGNTFDTYVGEDGKGHVKHYLLDFAGCLGSRTTGHKPPHWGHAYLWDPGRGGPVVRDTWVLGEALGERTPCSHQRRGTLRRGKLRPRCLED